jgi:Fis family transcriptional regulator
MVYKKALDHNPEVFGADQNDIDPTGGQIFAYTFERRKNNRRQKDEVPLALYLKHKAEQYFNQLNGHDPVGFYVMVINEVEKALLVTALEYAGHNQTKAAKALGLSRSTLRKKMEQYQLF